MLLPRFWPVLALLLPTTSLAQTGPRLYIGAGAALMRFSPFEAYAATYVGPAATIGLQLSSRWALESGAQLAWRNHTDSFYFVAADGGPTTIVTVSVHTRSLLVPLLARYTFTAPAARWQAEVLGGLSWLHGSGTSDYTSVTSGASPNSATTHSSSDNLGLTLGPQLRYRLASALDLKVAVPIYLAVTGNGEFRNRLLAAPQLGVQYAFGR